MEERNLQKNIAQLLKLLDLHGWPLASEVTETAAAGAALIINHSTYAIRSKYFPMLEKAFEQGEASSLLYAQMCDRLLVEEQKEQRFGTQIKFEDLRKEPYPISDPGNVDQRRTAIGLEPLAPYLKSKFNIDWNIPKKE